MNNKAFIDANFLVDVLNNSKRAINSMKLLKDAGFNIYTFRKCIYEVKASCH
jgi:rRNA-processing protein FCF1